MSDYTVVPAQEMKRITSSGATILDVRTPAEHDEQHLMAMHDFVPLDQLDPSDFMLRRGLDSSAPVYILCRSGMRARKAADMFGSAGYKNLYVIEGGILACESNGEPVEGNAAASVAPPVQAAPRKKAIPLERQVRIVAGAVIILGATLGYILHPVFYLLCFGAGAGLFYSGITGDCRLALVLMKAPWNKNAGASCAANNACQSNTSLPKTPSAPTAGGCA